MAHYGRRQFIQFMGLVGLGATAPILTWSSPGRASSPEGEATRTLPLMNTLVTVTVLDRSRQRAVTAQNAAFETMEKLIPIFDRFQPDSHVSHLNRFGTLLDVPPDLTQVLTACSELYAQSHRHFDVTILPLLQKTRHTVRRTGHPLSPQEIRDLKPLIGFRHVHHTSRSVRLDRSGMGLTFDGIAKGYIVDQAALSVVRHGVQSALINAGGDIRVIGGKGDQRWRIGIQDPKHKNAHTARLGLRQAAVATSGSYEQFFDPLARHHHLVNTSGYSPHRPVSATVVAPTTMQADGLASALFLMPPQKGLQLAASLPGVQAALTTRGNRTMTTPGWNDLRI